MKLYIPELGDRIKLTKDWSFPLYNEKRNTTLMALLGDTRDYKYHNLDCSFTATIPAETILIVDRVYIRQGYEDMSSITFRWEGAKAQAKAKDIQYPFMTANGPRTPARQVRFWARLENCNEIEFEKVV